MSDTTRENMERVAKNIHSLADPDTYWPRPGGRTAAATEAAAMLRALLDAKEAAERELEEWQRVRTGEGDRAMSERDSLPIHPLQAMLNGMNAARQAERALRGDTP